MTWKTLLKILSLLLMFMLPLSFGCSGYIQNMDKIPEDGEVPYRRTTFSFDQGTYPSSLDLFSEYRIAPGDILDVVFQIYRTKQEKFPVTLYHTVAVKFVNAPELNEVQEVLPDGTISLAYLGSVDVLGKTSTEIAEDLKKRYSKILKNPEIYVTLPKFSEQATQLREDLRTAPRGLSKLINVRPDGQATFPLVGELLVARKTIKRVNEELQERLNERLPGIQIDLFLEKHTGQVVYMLGEVRKPGAFEIMRPINILEALTLAGGYSEKAELRSVVVFRQHDEKQIARCLDIKALLELNRRSEMFYLRPDDTVFVPKTYIGSLSELMLQIQNITMFRGWSIGIGDSVDWVGPNRTWGSGP